MRTLTALLTLTLLTACGNTETQDQEAQHQERRDRIVSQLLSNTQADTLWRPILENADPLQTEDVRGAWKGKKIALVGRTEFTSRIPESDRYLIHISGGDGLFGDLILDELRLTSVCPTEVVKPFLKKRPDHTKPKLKLRANAAIASTINTVERTGETVTGEIYTGYGTCTELRYIPPPKDNDNQTN